MAVTPINLSVTNITSTSVRLNWVQWTPLQGAVEAWYDPSDLSTLFQDDAGTTPVTTNGDPVGLMQDKSGNGNDASESVSANRPSYPGLAYDGVDDELRITVGLGSTDFIISTVIGTQGLTGRRPSVFGFGSFNNTSEAMLLYANTNFGTASDEMRLFGLGTEILIGPDIRNTGDIVVTVVRENNTFSLYINGTFFSSGSASGSVSSTGLIGSWPVDARHYNGDKIGEMVIAKTSSEPTRLKIESYLASEAGIAL